MRALTTAATGMLAQQLNVETIANNIANATATGFKRERAEFADLLYQSQQRVGTQSSDTGTVFPAGIQVGLGVKPVAVFRIHDQGNLQQTNNPLDVAIKGRGYFQINLPDGTTVYTRDGSFKLSSTGEIVNAAGYSVAPGLTIPQNASAISIDSTGQVQASVPGQTAPQVVGQLQLAAFVNDAGLENLGDNLLGQTEASGQAVTGNAGSTGFGTLQQNFLETSNVNIVQEITSLITAQRAYEINSKVIQAADDMLSNLNQIR
jgi:flagellar basal-body rod protein FlgG